MLPDDPESTILKKLKKPRPEDTDNPDAPPPADQHGKLGNPADNRVDAGYDRRSRIGDAAVGRGLHRNGALMRSESR